MLNDLRYTARTLRRSPVFSAAVVLTVALAIAADTAIFSVVHTVIVRPLPFAAPDRLVQVGEKNDAMHLPIFGVYSITCRGRNRRRRCSSRRSGLAPSA